jgi:hypothetical protein
MRRLSTALCLALLAGVARADDDPSALLAAADALPAARADEASALYDRALAALDPRRDGPQWLHAVARKCWLIVHPQPAAALQLVASAAPLAGDLGTTADWQQLHVCGGYAQQRLERPGTRRSRPMTPAWLPGSPARTWNCCRGRACCAANCTTSAAPGATPWPTSRPPSRPAKRSAMAAGGPTR